MGWTESLCVTCSKATATQCTWLSEGDKKGRVFKKQKRKTRGPRYNYVVIKCKYYEKGPLPPIAAAEPRINSTFNSTVRVGLKGRIRNRLY